MKRRSRAGGKASKAQGREALKTKRRDVSKNASSSAPIQNAEVARLTRELNEAREQQAATSEVLKAISRSTFDLRTVLDALLQSAVRLCSADQGTVAQRKGGTFYRSVSYGFSPVYLDYVKDIPVEPARDTGTGRALFEGKVIHIPDVLADPDFTWKEGQRLGDFRTVLGVPMLREGVAVGVLALTRSAVRPFSDEQIALVENFAAQAVIAIENARLLNELKQSLERQTATSEVLQVISSSPGDLQPIFATMLEKAVRICDAKFGTLYLHEDGRLRLVAAHDVPEFLEARGGSPIQPAPDGGLERVMRTKRTIHISDLAQTQSYAERHPRMVEAVELAGIRTVVAVPLLKDNSLIGVIAVHRREVSPFSDKQIALVENFAAQAVIAIENARLLNELRQSLEQQTATSQVLQIISSSPSDLEPVFQAMLENAVRICRANFGNLFLYEDDAYRVVAMHNAPEGYADLRRSGPVRPPPETALGRVAATKQVVQIEDLMKSEAYAKGVPLAVTGVSHADIRTLLAVPMLKDDRLVGAIVIYRREVRPFEEKQIELLQNFAAQAVIAIENARLLNELRQRTTDLGEALEQQTATSEVLQVISSSPGELEPVFSAMLARATRICGAEFGNLFLREGEYFRAVAWHGEPTYVNTWRGPALIIKTDIADIPLARLAAMKQRVHVADLRQEAAYKAGLEPLVALVDKGAARTFSLCQCSRNTLWSAQSLSIVKKFALSPTSRSNCWRTSLPKQ